MPHRALSGSKLTVRNGSSISAVQPISLRRTRAIQMPSHSRATVPPAAVGPLSPCAISPSPIKPTGLISK